MLICCLREINDSFFLQIIENRSVNVIVLQFTYRISVDMSDIFTFNFTIINFNTSLKLID